MILQLAPDTPLLIRALAGTALVTHIAGASLGIVSGLTALLAAKGRPLHRLAGNVFFGSMLAMSAVAAVVAPMLPDRISGLMGAFTFYLTLTAWTVIRRPAQSLGRVERGAGFAALAIAAVAVALGALAAQQPKGLLDGEPSQIVVVLALVATASGLADFSVVRRGGLFGPPRTARHLWRMCLALAIATGSAAAQPKVVQFLPHSVRASGLTILPALAVLVLMVFWLIRTRLHGRRRLPANLAPAT